LRYSSGRAFTAAKPRGTHVRYAAEGSRVYGHFLFGVPAKADKIQPDEDLEGSIPFSTLLTSVELVVPYTAPRPRSSSQVNLDKNADPPWDPDPVLP